MERRRWVTLMKNWWAIRIYIKLLYIKLEVIRYIVCMYGCYTHNIYLIVHRNSTRQRDKNSFLSQSIDGLKSGTKSICCYVIIHTEFAMAQATLKSKTQIFLNELKVMKNLRTRVHTHTQLLAVFYLFYFATKGNWELLPWTLWVMRFTLLD